MSCVCHAVASVHCCLLRKGWPLGSCLWCLCFCHFPMWYPGSGVVLDCIDSWSLPPFLLCNAPIWDETAEVHYNQDNHIQNFHLGSYIVRYTFGNQILLLLMHFNKTKFPSVNPTLYLHNWKFINKIILNYVFSKSITFIYLTCFSVSTHFVRSFWSVEAIILIHS